jgi:hypothetical protein
MYTDEQKPVVQRASRHQALTEDDPEFYPGVRLPPSVRRQPRTDAYVIPLDKNRQLAIHPPKRRYHYDARLVSLVVVVVVFTVLFGVHTAINAWNDHLIDLNFGYPRTWQTDAVVGHNDSETNQTHFIFLNLRGHINIIEIPGGDSAHARMYTGPTLVGDDVDKIPITGELKDSDGDGKTDMIVHIGDRQTVLYKNDGTQFKPE